ncbi:MAG: response regulator [bacterium]
MPDKALILIVEDNRDMLDIYCRELKDDDYLIDTSDTVIDAIKKIRKKTYNVVTVDLKMPGLKSPEEMGGLEVMKEILESSPSTQIIVVTGFGTSKLAREAFKDGVYDFIDKPINYDELRKIIKNGILETMSKVQRINPFCSKTGVEPRVFGGRFKESCFFEGKLREAEEAFCDHFLVLGNWGTGKTTLLREFKMLAQKKGCIASIVSLDEFSKNSTVLDGIECIIQGILRDLPFTGSKLETLTKQLTSLGISIMGTGFNYNRELSELKLQPQALLHDTLLSLWKDIKKNKGKSMIVMLDDVHYFEPISEILTTIKQVLSHESIVKRTKILFILTCLPEKWNEFTSLKRHHPVGRYFLSKINLFPLSKEELVYTVEKTIEDTEVTFSQEVIEKVYFYTQGHPFEMQVLCRNLYENQIAGKVDLSVWEKALQNTLVDLGTAIFDHWLDEASKGEAEVLKMFAFQERALTKKEITQLLFERGSRITSGNIGKYLQRLVDKKLLDKVERGSYEISDRMFCAYVRLFKAENDNNDKA